MGHPIRTLVWISGLLATGSFGYVLVFAPVGGADTHPARDRATIDPASLNQLDQSFRKSLIGGRSKAAENISLQMINHHPEAWVSWFSRGLILGRVGKDQAAFDAWGELMVRLDPMSRPDGDAERSRWLYFQGWAWLGRDHRDKAAEFFHQAAALYEQVNAGNLNDPRVAYNLTCYWSMAGEGDRAIEHWERTLEAPGRYIEVSHWWWTDPDLDPIRHDPRFMDLARKHRYIE